MYKIRRSNYEEGQGLKDKRKSGLTKRYTSTRDIESDKGE